MTLTAYSGVTNPTVALGASGVAAGAATMPNPVPFITQVGDRFITFVVYNSSTASVSSIANTGTALTWTRQGSITTQGTNRFEVWASTPATNVQSTLITVTMSASVTGIATSIQVTGFPGAPVTPVVSSGSSTTPSSTGPTTTSASGLLLWTGANVTTSTQSIQRSIPANNFVIIAGSGSGTLIQHVSAVALEGVPNVAPSVLWNNITSGVWFSSGVIVPGPTVQLDDLAFQMRDDNTAVLLNDPNDFTPPFYDVEKVTGLDDATVNYSSSEIDGSHGSYIQAKFLTGKTVVLEGTLYATPPVDEALVDAVKLNWRPAPSSTIVPFYYKKPNQSPRWSSAKPISFKCDVDRGRAIGQLPFQAQFAAPDPRSYSLPVLRLIATPTTSSQYDDSVAVGGNIETFPIIYFNVYPSEIAAGSYQFFNLTIPSIVSPLTITAATLASGAYAFDLGARTLTRVVSGVDYSSAITSRNWWWLVPGITNAIRLIRVGGVTTDGFSMSYADAWR